MANMWQAWTEINSTHLKPLRCALLGAKHFTLTYLTFTKTLWDKYHKQSYFKEKETEAQRVSQLPKVIRPGSSIAGIQTQSGCRARALDNDMILPLVNTDILYTIEKNKAHSTGQTKQEKAASALLTFPCHCQKNLEWLLLAPGDMWHACLIKNIYISFKPSTRFSWPGCVQLIKRAVRLKWP